MCAPVKKKKRKKILNCPWSYHLCKNLEQSDIQKLQVTMQLLLWVPSPSDNQTHAAQEHYPFRYKKSFHFPVKIQLTMKEGQVCAHPVMGNFTIVTTAKEPSISCCLIVFEYAYFDIYIVSMPENKISCRRYIIPSKKNGLK